VEIIRIEVSTAFTKYIWETKYCKKGDCEEEKGGEL
jgi:hypothetical protein